MCLAVKPQVSVVLKVLGLVTRGRRVTSQESKSHESCAEESISLTCSFTYEVVTARKEGGREKSKKFDLLY